MYFIPAWFPYFAEGQYNSCISKAAVNMGLTDEAQEFRKMANSYQKYGNHVFSDFPPFLKGDGFEIFQEGLLSLLWHRFLEEVPYLIGYIEDYNGYLWPLAETQQTPFGEEDFNQSF